MRSLDEPLRAELVRDELGESIRAGRLLPGHEQSLHDLAESNQVRVDTLRLLLESLAAERLVTVCGDAVVVAPLDADHFVNSYRLIRQIEDQVLARACEKVAPAELSTLRKRLVRISSEQGLETFNVDLQAFAMGVLSPGITAPEKRLLGQLHQVSRRYVTVGSQIHRSELLVAAPGTATPEQRALDMYQEILDRMAVGDPRGAIWLMNQNSRGMLGELALDSPPRPQPSTNELAVVLDFATAARRRRR